MKKEKAAKPEKKRKPLSKKQKDILFGVSSFAGSFIVTAVIILTFAVFIPQGKINEQRKKYNNAVSLLDNGNYIEAASYLKNLGYEDSNQLYHVAQAGQYFSSGDYESGIQSIHDAGGDVSVHYDPNGGAISNNREVFKIKKKWVENKPTRNGYDFLDWNVSSFILSYASKNYSADLNLLASWNIVDYAITYNLNGGSLSNLPTSYNIDTPDFSLGAPVKKGYTFIGWSGTDINDKALSVSVEKGSIGDRSYTANYVANQYTVTYDYNYDSLSDSQVVTFDTNYSLINIERVGYQFNGWYYNGQKVEDGKWSIDSDVTLVANWSIKQFSINYNLNGGTNNPNNPNTFTYFDEVTLNDPTKAGYEFNGWYANNTKVSSIPAHTDTAVSLEARWSPIKNELVVASEDVNYGTVSILSGSGYTDEEIIVKAEPAEDYSFLGWHDGTSIVSNAQTYTFTMPPHDYSLTAHFIDDVAYGSGVIPTYKNKVVTYGLYPKTHVNERSLINELGTAGVNQVNGWTKYNNEYYYQARCMYNSGYFDDGTEFTPGSDYWFKCEPIEWDVLSTDERGVYVTSKEILDTGTFKGNQFSDAIYKADYENSAVRTWLNTTFLQNAFCLSNAYLRTNVINNGPSSTDSVNNNNCCNNTLDTVCLGSYQDFYNMGPDSDRMCYLTDFARTQSDIYWNQEMVYGYEIARCYAPYFTRSPVSTDNGGYLVWAIKENGNFTSLNTSITLGIRPCVYISTDIIDTLEGDDVIPNL